MCKIFRKNINLVFVIYLILLIYIVAFKASTSVKDILFLRNGLLSERNMGYWNYNLVLFQTIQSSLSMLSQGAFRGLATMIINIIIFIPYGFLLSVILLKPSFLKVLFISLFLILGIEVFQFITCIGVFDIDDIILNVMGTILGYMIYFFVCLFRRCRPK